MLTDKDWEVIKDTYVLLLKSNLTKIEDKKWTMYKVGTIIRLDIKTGV